MWACVCKYIPYLTSAQIPELDSPWSSLSTFADAFVGAGGQDASVSARAAPGAGQTHGVEHATLDPPDQSRLR